MKSVRIRSYSGRDFSAFGLNTDQNNFEYGHFSRSVTRFEHSKNAKSYIFILPVLRTFYQFSYFMFHNKQAWFKETSIINKIHGDKTIKTNQCSQFLCFLNWETRFFDRDTLFFDRNIPFSIEIPGFSEICI